MSERGPLGLCCHLPGACPRSHSHFNIMPDHLHTLRGGATDEADAPRETPLKRKFPIPTFAKLLPWLLVAAFVLLAWLLFGDRFERARPVELVKVVASRASAAESSAPSAVGDSLSFAGGTLFQASGWIESDPLPIRATTLYSGVVKAVLFQPDSLQARIDVPLEEAAQLRIGQPVRLRSTLLPNQTFLGQVTRIDGQADLQRNTLQDKVRVLEGLRPGDWVVDNPPRDLEPGERVRNAELPTSNIER